MGFKRKVKQQKLVFPSEGHTSSFVRNFSLDNNCYSWITVNYLNSNCRLCCRLTALNWLTSSTLYREFSEAVEQWGLRESLSTTCSSFANLPHTVAHRQAKQESVTFHLIKSTINLNPRQEKSGTYTIRWTAVMSRCSFVLQFIAGRPQMV
jgi:hypothetical protein